MNPFVYDISAGIGQLIARVVHGWDVEGKENVITTGPFVLASNHAGIIDPWLVACGTGRRVSFMAKVELFQHPVMNWWMRAVGSFPVKRGEADREAIRTALRLLKEGHPIGIFVEGTRNPDGRPLPIQPGAAMLAVKANVPILPVAMVSQGRRKITRFGRPIYPPQDYEGPARELYRQLSVQLGQTIDELKLNGASAAIHPHASQRSLSE